MKNQTGLSRWASLNFALMLVLLAGTASAQNPTPSPTPEKTKTNQTTQQSSANGEQMLGDYKVTSSIEVGVRGLSVVGSGDKYRSDLNYRPGVRIFDSSFLLQRKDHQGSLFDELLVNSSGWGGDPQGYTRVNIEKSGIYRFDANARRFKYFNNLTNLALGQHTHNTRMQFGDYALTLLPDNQKLKFYLGYSRDTLRGPGLMTYDFSRDEFAINTNQQTRANNFRVGVDGKLGPINISLLQGVRYFTDDTTENVSATNQGNNPSNTSRIDTLIRHLPTSGHHFFTRFSAHTSIAKRLDLTARYIYTGSTTNFSFFEQVSGRSGISPFNIINQETFTTSGRVKRPYGIGEIGATFLATPKLRLSDTFRVDQFHISGGDLLSDFLVQSTAAGAPVPPTTTLSLFQRSTRYRRFMNTVEGDYQFNRNYSIHAGYRFTDRHVEIFSLNAPEPAEDELFNNKAHSVIFGLKARPVPVWTIYFDGEHGSADSVFTRLENNKFTNLRARNRIALNNRLFFSGSFVIRTNTNPTEVLLADTQLPAGTAPNALDVNVRSRVFTTTMDWTPDARFSLSVGYTHMRVTSDAGIILFVNNHSQVGRSEYFMKDHFFFFNVSARPLPRVTLFASYRINRDPGQGNLVSPALNVIIGSYPMTFQAPEARIVVKLTRRVDWNAGYQYYNYRDWFTPVQNYHSHLPYTSLRVYFGGPRE